MSEKMKEITVRSVTLNVGVGEGGEKLENAKNLLKKLTERKVVATKARVRNPVFKLKKGEPIGAKVTLRRKSAVEFLKKAFEAVDSKIPARSFDRSGNFSFGIKEYIDFPGAKYDPKIGIIGFDVCVSLGRKGFRVKERRRRRSSIGRKHFVTREEGMEFVKKNFNAELV